MAALLEVDHLYKRYGAVVVADDICCTVDRASCVGLIGPNGAGLSGANAQQLAVDVLNKTGLLAHADEPAGHLRLLDRKRLELAKAIASRAKLLLLDEIASGLTEYEVAALIDLIAALKADHAIIWIEHIPHALRAVADRIMVLHFGSKVLDGAPAEVMSSPMVREIYMGLPADAA